MIGFIFIYAYYLHSYSNNGLNKHQTAICHMCRTSCYRIAIVLKIVNTKMAAWIRGQIANACHREGDSASSLATLSL